MNVWTALAAGLAAGSVHVLAGPDHLAAIGVLSVDSRSKLARLGFRWGLGHSLGVLIIGAAAIVVRSFTDLEAVARWGEPLVGLALVAAGVRAILVWRRPPAEDVRPAARWAGAFGTLHGLAGSSHLWGTLPALALAPDGPAQAYLAAFCAASIAAMTLFAAVLGWARARTLGGSGRAWERGALAAGAASILIGIGWTALALA